MPLYSLHTYIFEARSYRLSLKREFNFKTCMTVGQRNMVLSRTLFVCLVTVVAKAIEYTIHLKCIFFLTSLLLNSRDGEILVVTRLWDGRSVVRFPAAAIFLFSKVSRLALGPPRPPIQWIKGTFCQK